MAIIVRPSLRKRLRLGNGGGSGIFVCGAIDHLPDRVRDFADRDGVLL